METGTAYLLHFDKPLAHAKHFIGWTGSDVEQAVAYAAETSAILRAAKRAGITWRLAFVWSSVSRDFEQNLHRRKNATAKLCPICKGASNG